MHQLDKRQHPILRRPRSRENFPPPFSMKNQLPDLIIQRSDAYPQLREFGEPPCVARQWPERAGGPVPGPVQHTKAGTMRTCEFHHDCVWPQHG
eukprot:2520808-Amphidinium_carterae.1